MQQRDIPHDIIVVMATIFDQENITTSHQTIAANKPLNQTIKALQPKTPGNNLKTPFRGRNDENTFVNIGKSTKNTFATPAPAPRTANRAPLGAKTTNAKAQAFQTPAPDAKSKRPELTERKASSTRRTIKKKIYVDTEQPVQSELRESEQDEPDFGYAPPPIVPLPDPPMEFDYDQTYAALRPENFNRGVGEIYFQSPKDENGFSISLKKMEERERESLQRDLDRIFEAPEGTSIKVPDLDDELDHTKPVINESNINTLKSRSAAAALSFNQPPRTHKPHARLPSAVTAQTASSKQKRKSTFSVSRDIDLDQSSVPPRFSNATIGFPKAKKAPSILPQSKDSRSVSHMRSKSHNSTKISTLQEEEETDTHISPKKFVEIHGEPSLDSDMWTRLKELEIRDRRRDDGTDLHEEPIFDFDDDELDRRLALGSADSDEDFELTMD